MSAKETKNVAPSMLRRLRATLKRIVGSGAAKGGILAALRRSPLVGAELDQDRQVTRGRSCDL
jgi:hypothetical protein